MTAKPKPPNSLIMTSPTELQASARRRRGARLPRIDVLLPNWPERRFGHEQRGAAPVLFPRLNIWRFTWNTNNCE